ncbi:DUF2515 family protein [Massilia endophytica]|uniref:DUF2515 family protein n=1 Tax=Massilia endophytica TaxID=2899220 RepID=UPI001E30C71E|nr:hypothetical protein [Massilia endophytica]UGQ47424.1 hypothetical protein LSQ66_02775 [Massilia endophytica]
MPVHYEPGKANPYFPIHRFHGIPLNRNIKPIEDCRLKGYVGMDGHANRGIAMEILTPEYLWETFQKEAEDVIKSDGAFISDVTERNKRINAAYAKLWLADNRFQWAGLAAFASKQVGCGLLHAHQLSEKNQRELSTSARWAGDNSEAASLGAIPYAIQGSADYMYERLGFGNKHLFLDIYPLHRFYMERGLAELAASLPKRQNVKGRVVWDADQLLDFGKPFREIRMGFDSIDRGEAAKSVEALAWHEQVNILQAILYNDPHMQEALAKNQLAWAIGFPSGVYTEIQLTLSAQCKAKDGWTTYFSRLKNAKLWVAEERMQFVKRAATQFDELLRNGQRRYVEESLRAISVGQGIK